MVPFGIWFPLFGQKYIVYIFANTFSKISSLMSHKRLKVTCFERQGEKNNEKVSFLGKLSLYFLFIFLLIGCFKHMINKYKQRLRLKNPDKLYLQRISCCCVGLWSEGIWASLPSRPEDVQCCWRTNLEPEGLSCALDLQFFCT